MEWCRRWSWARCSPRRAHVYQDITDEGQRHPLPVHIAMYTPGYKTPRMTEDMISSSLVLADSTGEMKVILSDLLLTGTEDSVLCIWSTFYHDLAAALPPFSVLFTMFISSCMVSTLLSYFFLMIVTGGLFMFVSLSLSPPTLLFSLTWIDTSVLHGWSSSFSSPPIYEIIVQLLLEFLVKNHLAYSLLVADHIFSITDSEHSCVPRPLLSF